MKAIDILCTSQASTSIHFTMDEPSSSATTTTTTTTTTSSSSISSTTTHLTSGRAIDRHNPIIRDEKRLPKSFINPPCSNPQNPISPKPHKHHYKSILSGGSYKSNKGISGNKSKVGEQKRKGQGGWGCTKPSAFISPPSSSRYLLSDKALLNVLNDFDPILTLVQKENSKAVQRDEPSSSSSSSFSASKVQPTSSSHSVDQVVVLRVSLHCKGCERKMRKHISRMEGVTSFNIDFAAKKLTVVGDVTPLSVLASVSKVKNATLLTPMTISSSSAPIPPPPPPPEASLNYMAEIDTYQEIVV